MLEEKDIQKIKEGLATTKDLERLTVKLATREEFDQFREEIKQEFAALREQIQALTISVDKLVTAVENLRQEYFAIKSQVDRHEKWLHQIAEKLGIKLEY
jgi:uncharacterized coiled-coil DUF342 family protein